jgi:hypothetical protein
MWILNVEGFKELLTNAKGCVEKIKGENENVYCALN